jgi:hypothetical protein
MTVHVCDHRDCPALALRHVDLFGQDFHFCNHHWTELAPAIARAEIGPSLEQALGSVQAVDDPVGATPAR